MIDINIVGDFCVENLDGLSFGEKLQKQLQSAKINVVNFEGPIFSEKGVAIKKSGPNLYQSPNCPSRLIDEGFNVFSLANNHIMDYGEYCAEETKNCFNNYLAIGYGDFRQAYKLGIYESEGKKIGFLSLTQYEFGILDDELFARNSKGAAWLLHPTVDTIIIEAHTKCDVLIILPHAGLENFEYPLPELRTLYKHFIDMGADAVIGGHPHIPQGWELYKNAPIIYSLGNFCFEALNINTDYWDKGLLAKLTITDEDNKILLNFFSLHFDRTTKCIDIIDSQDFTDYLNKLCNTLQNDNDYLDLINKKCLELENHYCNLIEASGYYRPTIRRYYYLLRHLIKNHILHKVDKYDQSHLINNMRCETHRWVLSRIYNLKYSNI